MPYKTIQQNFANGELNPKMQGRSDVDMYYKSAQKMRDVVTTPYGGFVRRPGSTKLAELTSVYDNSGEKSIRLFPFVFNNEQTYLLAVTDGNLDIFYNDTLLENIPVEAFSDVRIPTIKYIQSADTGFFIHPDFKPIQLKRGGISPTYSNSSVDENDIFTLISTASDGFVESNYPVAIENKDFEFAFEVQTGSLPSGTTYPYYRNTVVEGFDENGSRIFSIRWRDDRAGSTGSAMYQGYCEAHFFIEGWSGQYTQRYVQYNNDDETQAHTYNLKLSYDHSTGVWTPSYKRDNDNWASLQTATYSISKKKISSIKITSYCQISNPDHQQKVNLGSANTYLIVDGNTAWTYETGLTQSWNTSEFSFSSIPTFDYAISNPVAGNTTATPDQLDGTVKITLGASISANLVGQYFEGNGARVKITSQSGTTLTGYTVIGFYTTNTINAGGWTYTQNYEPVWSDTRGWPCSATFHGGRLWFGGSKSRPQTVWGSKVGMFDKFDPSSGYDNDAIEFTLDTNDLNKITDIYSQKNLLIFTTSGEFACLSSFNEPITPDNVNATKQTTNGSWEKTSPVDIEGAVMFIERKGQGLMVFASNENTTDIYNSSNSSLINSHLISSPVDLDAERNNLTQQTNYIYIANEDGSLCVVNLLASQGITGGYTLWKTQGKYKSVCVLPDSAYVAVERETPAGYKLFLEKLNYEELADCSRSVTLNNSDTFTVDEFADREVDLFINGVYYGTQKADSDGVITLSGAITASITAGLLFRWQVQSNFLEIPQLGVGMSKKKRLATMTVRTLDTPELTVNGETQPGGEGIKDIEYYGIGDWSEKPTWIMQEKNPCKVNVMAVQMNVNFQVAGDEY